jgi:hypothetical protein
LNESGLDINFLTQYFSNHNIKKIASQNGELVITYNNNLNEIITNNQLVNNAEYQLLRDNLRKINKNELTSQELEIGSGSGSTPTLSPNNNALLIGGSLILVLIIGVVVGLLLRKRKNKYIWSK